MSLRSNIEALKASGISYYRVAKDAGIPETTVKRIFTGEANIDNISLKNAEALSEYYDRHIEEQANN